MEVAAFAEDAERGGRASGQRIARFRSRRPRPQMPLLCPRVHVQCRMLRTFVVVVTVLPLSRSVAARSGTEAFARNGEVNAGFRHAASRAEYSTEEEERLHLQSTLSRLSRVFGAGGCNREASRALAASLTHPAPCGATADKRPTRPVASVSAIAHSAASAVLAVLVVLCVAYGAIFRSGKRTLVIHSGGRREWVSDASEDEDTFFSCSYLPWVDDAASVPLAVRVEGYKAGANAC